ncbi:hypothetical protein D9615_005709 [Tricholomella constricta]|uniref:Major facilitator superfamily (MFS) profile domain-containing protein n=1 Tax=Tricholomella constricta TaxID=117010 RepID=A0A8H5HAL8_9AGAR|nr:hypothetical protein D9615_005709 [Tricholomella constricta]
MMSELTDAKNLPRLWAFMPLSWSIGVTVSIVILLGARLSLKLLLQLGPMIGGYLSRPAERFPSLFGQNEFFKLYPYFLPCAFPAAFSAISWIITFYFLKETVKSPVPIFQLLKRRKNGPIEACSLNEQPIALRSILVPRVIIAVGNYAFVALIEIAFRAIQPLFFATPMEFGGLGLPPSSIGIILSVSGALAGVVQVFFFARIYNFLGSKRTFVAGMVSSAPLFLTFPITSFLGRTRGFTTLLWVMIGVQAILPLGFGVSFGAIFMYITAAPPSRAALGATHGLSQMAISIVRAIGPAASNGLFSLSIEHDYLGGYLVYYILFAVACIGMALSSFLPRKV